MAETLSARFASWITKLEGRQLEARVIEKLKLAVLDTIASMLAGVREDVVLRMIPYATDGDVRSEASILGHKTRGRLASVALVNGTIAHACDYDDSSWLMWGHPSAPVLPAALVVAERDNLSGLDFLTGFAAGIEVQKAIGLGCQPENYQRGYHSTGSLGVFGATAATSKMLRLSVEQTQMALGLAVSRSASLRGNFGTMAKPLHVGFAARDGVEAALLAQAGITSNPMAFEGPTGFFQVLGSPNGRPERLDEALGHPFEVVDPGLSPKLYSSCSEGHASIDAILEMRAEGLRPSDVKTIRCGITPAAQGNLVYSSPTTPLQAKFSQEYVVAAALARGKLGISEFEPEAINDPTTRELMQKIEVAVHSDLSGPNSITFSSPAIVEIETNDGRKLRKVVREMKGHPKNPLSFGDIEQKYAECAAKVLSPKNAAAVLAKISTLERLNSMRELVGNLTND